MRISYDAEADAAYIHLFEKTRPSGPVKTVPVDPQAVDGMINLDLDTEGHLLGIEILDASRFLPGELLRPSD